jgi:hypothetical protein
MVSLIWSQLFSTHADRWWDLAEAVLMGVAGSWIALLFHELGHATAAWLVGVRIWGIRLGTGPTVWRASIGQWAAGQPGLSTVRGDVLVLGMAANFCGYLNLVPCFRSDGIHLLAHLHAARSRLAPIRN